MNEKGDLKILGIVGLRSGSKGIPSKNIKPLGGKPLAAWILEALKKSGRVNKIVASTDSEEYAGIARKYGAEVPFLRPKEISGDSSTDIEFIKHALEWYKEKESYVPDIVVRCLATCPLQRAEDIDSCIDELINDPEADSAVVIAKAFQHPMKALKLINDGNGRKKLVSYFSQSGKEVTPLARQSYEEAYFRANVIASRHSVIAEKNSLTGDLVRYHIIPQERAIDIDSPLDFIIAEQLIDIQI
ncbi:acylneuraminate cytidylyltransferase family protein [Candidatus Giovannonibacteria bacterium]|nr:acylneuraminate cytidylyltransferase family protein [Candidatus Giovannonibacteria bacterium]